MKTFNQFSLSFFIFFLLVSFLPIEASAQLLTFDINFAESLPKREPKIITRTDVQYLREKNVLLYAKEVKPHPYADKSIGVYETGKWNVDINPDVLWLKSGYKAAVYSDGACKTQIRVFQTTGVRDLNRIGLKNKIRCVIVVKKR